MMKKIFFLLLICCIGCGENKEGQEAQELSEGTVMQDSVAGTETKTPEKSFFCFFAIQNEDPASHLRDSVILNLELTGEVVSGNFNWIPAEKDSRRGTIQATRTGDQVKGNYAFTQEGVQDTLRIEIQLQKAAAVITTLSDTGEEMRLEVERVDCL